MHEEEMHEAEMHEAFVAFVDRTRITLEECGKWLQEHAEELSEEISGGCVSWCVTFKAGKNGHFPDVSVQVDGSHTRLVNEAQFIWAVTRFCACDERFEYGKPLVHEHGWGRREGEDRW